jgi:hypothetical protein
MNLKSGTTMTFTGGTEATLKVSANNVDVSPAGVTLQGTLLEFNGPANMNGMLVVGGQTTLDEGLSVSGNVGIGTNATTNPLEMGSGAYCSVAGVWTSVSDRNAKEDFAAINPREVLEKVSALPITEWKYKVEADGTEHLGPMAQDFHVAFGLNGADDKHIATIDEEGVALAAIQGLNQKLNEKDAQIQNLEKKLDALQAVVKKLVANK